MVFDEDTGEDVLIENLDLEAYQIQYIEYGISLCVPKPDKEVKDFKTPKKPQSTSSNDGGSKRSSEGSTETQLTDITSSEPVESQLISEEDLKRDGVTHTAMLTARAGFLDFVNGSWMMLGCFPSVSPKDILLAADVTIDQVFTKIARRLSQFLFGGNACLTKSHLKSNLFKPVPLISETGKTVSVTATVYH